jgi:hypothetical protein
MTLTQLENFALLLAHTVGGCRDELIETESHTLS